MARARASITTDGRILFGTDGDDSLYGTGGDDTVHGFAGNDFIDAGGGRDTVFAGKGDDTVLGGDGDDTILAQDRDSDSVGAWGRDKVDGGEGKDTIDYRLTTSNVYLGGGADDDVIYAGSGADTLDGGKGNDFLFGGNLSSDVLTGGEGADTFAFGMEAIHTPLPDGATSHTYFLDRVTDFSAKAGDRLDFPMAGTADNYAERSITLSPYFSEFRQLDAAADGMIDGEHHFAFITDGQRGYLFADIDFDKQWDTRVTLDGVGSVEKFDFSFIV